MSDDRMEILYIKHDGRYFEGDRRTCKRKLAEHLIRQKYALPYSAVKSLQEAKLKAAAEFELVVTGEPDQDDAPDQDFDPSSLGDEDLKEFAKEQGIKHVHVMKRDTILERLAEAESEDDDG